MGDWVNEHLDERFSNRLTDLLSDANVEIFSQELLSQEFSYVRAQNARRKRDVGAIAEIVKNNPEMAKMFTEPARRGRPQGTFGKKRATLLAASEAVDFVYSLWKRYYRRWKRKQANRPSAIEIVVARYQDMGFEEVTEEALVKFRKEHGRVLRD